MDDTTVLNIRPWLDPLVDDAGFDPRSTYVEHFWLGVLGPTATWLIRRLVAGFDQMPDGYELDLGTTAKAMGLTHASRRVSPFDRALQRCVMFGLAHAIPGGLAVRRRLPTVALRHLKRLPDEVQQAHDQWMRSTVTFDELSRAHRLALAMIDVGDDVSAIERQLVAIGVRTTVASTAAANAVNLND